MCDRSTRVNLAFGSTRLALYDPGKTPWPWPLMSFPEIAVLAMIAAMVAAFAASLKWLSLRTPFRRNANRR